jgi:hypothetical protein
MKKGLLFLSLFIYLCVSTGFAVSTHFCMDEQQSVEWGAVKKEMCGKCGMAKQENDGGCCRDEIKVVKLQQDTQLAKMLLPSFELALPVVLLSEYVSLPFYNFTETNTLVAHSPPLHQVDRYVANCVFRI